MIFFNPRRKHRQAFEIFEVLGVCRFEEVVENVREPSWLYGWVLAYRFLPEVSLSFRKHSPSKSADIRIARESRPEEFSARFLLSITAPHHTTQKYIVAVHFISFRYCLGQQSGDRSGVRQETTA
jgi:hypothetical protein